MSIKRLSRRKFVQQAGLLTSAGLLAPLVNSSAATRSFRSAKRAIHITTAFLNAGGDISLFNDNPIIIDILPHDEGGGGWSQMWWHFKIDGLHPNEEITLRLFKRGSEAAWQSPQFHYSYDGITWALSDRGAPDRFDDEAYFVYKHRVKSTTISLAYDLPYTPNHVDALIAETSRHPQTHAFELCKTRSNRPVHAIRIGASHHTAEKHGIWLQARSHSFESGTSWVVHELALWLVSDAPEASALRDIASMTIVPIIDVDGVVEGRTGKNQLPYDHNRGWSESPNHWPETVSTQSHLQQMALTNNLDLFIDFHGPGGLHHPYFIVPLASSLPTVKQQGNRSRFFETLQAKPLEDKHQRTQSMTQFYFSERPWERVKAVSSSWVTTQTTDHNIAVTLEVNMNTPFSTRDGYRAEAHALGKAIANYFTVGHHER